MASASIEDVRGSPWLWPGSVGCSGLETAGLGSDRTRTLQRLVLRCLLLRERETRTDDVIRVFKINFAPRTATFVKVVGGGAVVGWRGSGRGR